VYATLGGRGFGARAAMVPLGGRESAGRPSAVIAHMDYLRPLPNGGTARRAFCGISYATVPDRAARLARPEARALIEALPEDVRASFVERFLADEPGDTRDLAEHFAAHSAVCRHALGRPGAGLALDILFSG